MADFIYFDGFDDYFIEFYYSTNHGNGGYMLYDPKSASLLTEIHGVFDANFEGRVESYRELVDAFGFCEGDYHELSYIFEGGYLEVSHVDLTGNGYSDLVFTGTQQIYQGYSILRNSAECKVVYTYDLEEMKFVLDRDKSYFPEFWELNWNAIK